MTLGVRPAGSSSERARARLAAFVERGRLYTWSARRARNRYGMHPSRLVSRQDDRHVFVVGSPRSGTTFTATAIGSVPGFSDLGELAPLKAAIPELHGLPVAEAGKHVRRIVRWSLRVSQLAGTRGVEQTPESSFIIPAIAQAFPNGRFVHLVRDGRDSATSLLGLGWLAGAAAGKQDEVGASFGDQARFWVEPERASDFSTVSDAARAAWVWRRYQTAALDALAELPGRSLQVRYEDLVTDPAETSSRLAAFLGADEQREAFRAAFADSRDSATGRWRRELSRDQIADIESEAGPLLSQLGYCD